MIETRPTKARVAIKPGSSRRARGALRGPLRALAVAVVAIVELALCLSMFGPQPLGWLWVGSQVDFATGSLSAGLAVAFVGSVASIVFTVWLARWLESAWQALRPPTVRPGERLGLFETALVISTVLAVIGFAVWFFVIAGPGPTIAPKVN